ncbi:hypothetical protein SAMN02745824_0199 [Parasphingorhabdus marina DSM 22363]|uniref:Uncharacterized protein n=1 Tax=Parasphingorhabdus marina DSM 22363 TaxID=1123272 RepID=A0A1N6CM62_9SPHN|nr:hypothetical protein [Parasphingorhabdus marina]SIN59668.1 hypothetical protein SAMN02745824_0199 [Parasphingorhabdus marina DSM 22363]
MSLFGPKRPLSKDEWEWQLASFKWLLAEFGGIERNPTNVLVLPTAEYFPPTSGEPAEKAQQIFDQVRTLSGMAEWPTRLLAGEASKEANIASGISLVHENHAPAGEFLVKNGPTGEQLAEIRYNPRHLANPESLIATFAHELSHYLMANAKSDPPGGWDIHELTTDLTAVYLGFGIFMANSAWNFEGHSSFDQQGWQYERQGYLTERGLVTAIAIWETLAGRDPMAAAPFLKPHLAKDLKKATAYVHKNAVAQEIAEYDLEQY